MSEIFNECIRDVVICLSDHDLAALIPIYEEKEKAAKAAAKHHVPYTEDGLPRKASLAVQICWALRKERDDRRGQPLSERM